MCPFRADNISQAVERRGVLLEQLGAMSTKIKGRVRLGSVELRLVAADTAKSTGTKSSL